MTFESFKFSKGIFDAIQKMGYSKPSQIQQDAIPIILDGNDVLAVAQTGTGKTASFTLPLLQRLIDLPSSGKRRIRALVLAPTRELAAQVHENVRELSQFLDLKTAVIFGGVSEKQQITQLNNGVDILIATPGRLLDFYNRH